MVVVKKCLTHFFPLDQEDKINDSLTSRPRRSCVVRNSIEEPEEPDELVEDQQNYPPQHTLGADEGTNLSIHFILNH